jgi:translation initiation factor IF-3
VRFGARTEFLFELFIIFWRCLGISKENQINEEIRDKEVRVISADGEQVGVMSAKEAIALAEKANLDLVKIAPNAVPPVCKIMDYGKFKFEQAKKEKEARKNQHVVDIKEVRLGLNTDVGDFNTKVAQAKRFIQHGDKVKVNIRFRGREMGHPEKGIESMTRFAEACEEFATVEKAAKLEGRNMLMFLVPRKDSK